MYRQIKIAKKDTEYQRILWREDSRKPIQEYRLLTVTYGTSSAPFLAIRTLQQLAMDESSKYEMASKIALQDFYVDDIMSGADSLHEALALQTELRKMLKGGGLHLRKWSSNCQQLLEQVPEDDKELKLSPDFNINTTIKTLGIHWNPITDIFQFKIKTQPKEIRTKRELLSEISRLFDPLGWIAPTVITAKIMMQQLWLEGLKWDEELPHKLTDQWKRFRNELTDIENIVIPRWVNMHSKNEYEIHGFCDASTQAYAAVIYIRLEYDNHIHVSLLTAKTRIAPIKQLSLPRLELCAASLLAKLIQQIRPAFAHKPSQTYLWTDSTIVLAWLRGHPSKWKTFVANRVSDIHQRCNDCEWNHVLTKDNPADCASRGLSPHALRSYSLWWEGPSWLKDEKKNWPKQTNSPETKLEVKRNITLITTIDTSSAAELFERFSSWRKLLRVVAYCNRFLTNCKPSTLKETGYLKYPELNKAKNRIVRTIQNLHFKEEIRALKSQQPIPKKSILRNLNPFLDADGVLRLGGRLRHAHLSYNERFPKLLPTKCHITNLIIDDAHKTTLHGGAQLMLSVIRKEFWIIAPRNLVRQRIHSCVTCWRQKANTQQQLMGDLPEYRVNSNKPFQHTGIDFCGPIVIRESRCRGRIKTSKGYICIFICLTTKAIHLESVSDMTTEAFIAAFRRFTSRRGRVSHIYSDCGTNFVGASRKLSQINMQKEWGLTDDIYTSLENTGSQWHFIPPGAPHFGGIWESGVKSVKHHMKRITGNALLTFEELNTLLTQIEGCLNSRPLCPMSNDPEDLSVLTPGHFLVGNAILAPPEENLLDTKVSTINRWQTIQQMYQTFWKQWQSEYLHRLQQRPKWLQRQPNIKKGDIVMLKDERLPPTRWMIGRIIEVHPGNDGLVRVVTVKCKDSIFKRPITKICLLPIADNYTI